MYISILIINILININIFREGYNINIYNKYTELRKKAKVLRKNKKKLNKGKLQNDWSESY